MKRRLVTGGYAAIILLGLGWAAWAVLSAAGLETLAGGWMGQDATVTSVPRIGQLPWFGLMAAVAFYAIWQCLPQERTGFHRRLRPWVLGAVLCNALWVAFLERDRIGTSLVFGLLLLALLIRIVVMIGKTPALQQVDRWITRAIQEYFRDDLVGVDVVVHQGNSFAVMYFNWLHKSQLPF